MGIVLTKPLAVKTFCVVRQAERSLDFSLTSEKQWALLRHYYDEDRLQRACDVLDRLRVLTGDSPPEIARNAIADVSLFWLLAYPFRVIVNRMRSQWTFPGTEVQFISGALGAFLTALQHVDKPDTQELVQLRVDLAACQYVIEKRLTGLPELQRAANIEHFCQASHNKPVTIDDICGSAALVSA